MKYEIHTGTVHENTVREVIHTLSLINKTLEECVESPNPGNGEDIIHSRSRFVLQSAAVYLWLFQYRRIDHPDLVPAVKETIKRLQDVTGTFNVPSVEVTSSLESDADSELDGGADQVPWFTSEWWRELFSDFSQGSDGGSYLIGRTSKAHDGGVDDEYGMDMTSSQLPDEIRRPPPWPEPHFRSSSIGSIGRLPPSISSSAPSWQLRKVDPTDNIV